MRKQMLFASLLLSATLSQAALNIPGADGSDGSLHVATDAVIDLAQAPTGAWDDASTAAGGNGSNAGHGVYDPTKWAVVFKYASVTVEEGATLRFANHPTRAPVVWLVSGDVSIAGTVSLDGANGAIPPALAEPGPGGFRGGMADYSGGAQSGSGFGLGGGAFDDNEGFGGSYGAQSEQGPSGYGNPSIVPLVGGSGGGGDADIFYGSSGGGGGGGALLVVVGGVLSIDGNLSANGGSYTTPPGGAGVDYGGGGSGGGLRLLADSITGAGQLVAVGGTGYRDRQDGAVGRIRLEYITDNSSLTVAPSPSVVPLTDGSTALIWPPETAPSARIISVGGEPVGDDPLASFGTHGADVAIPETETTPVVIETTNIEQASEVFVRVTPRSNAAHQFIPASLAATVSETPLVLHWEAQVPLGVGYSAMQGKIIRP